jgi:hypothetical protein
MRALIKSILIASLGCSGLATGCGSEESPPEPPSNLELEMVEGQPSLTWVDNSDDEIHFMVLRRVGGEGMFTVVAEPPADSTTHTDTMVTSGETYSYVVVAMNNAGSSESTNEVSATIP